MLVLVVAQVDLARQISGFVAGPINYIVQVKDDVELRHKVYSQQPDILLLDYRMGGSVYKASDQVPLLMEKTTSQPYVILLLPWRTRAVDREAAKLGCYDVVNVNAKNFRAELLDRISVAKAARAAGLPALRRRAPPTVH